MKIEDFPKFQVSSIETREGKIAAKGKADSRKWIGERHIAYLFASATQPIEGRFIDYDEATGIATFLLKHESQKLLVHEDTAYPYTDGYWGERVWVTLGGLDWQKERYSKEGDHDHCFYCWATISSVENSEYWRSGENDVVCQKCYEAYVLSGSLDFIHENI